MYVDFYGFQKKPFSLTPDPGFVFLSKSHREAFAHLLYGINNRVGFILLTGEVGSGKTTVLRALLNQLDARHYRTALIFNPCLSAPELIQNVNREFAIQMDASGGAGLLDSLNPFLLQQNSEGRTVVLVIDEAQNLKAPVLEQIRLISNLETDRDKLIQIVLSGQPELMQILKKKEMRQLNQRITVRYHLHPMDYEDTKAYMSHRLSVAGRTDGAVFSRGAVKKIYRYSGGLPRLINAASDRALLVGYASDEARVTSRVAAAGINDLGKDTVSYRSKRRFLLPAAAVVLVALVLSGIYLTDRDFFKGSGSSQSAQGKDDQRKDDQRKEYPLMTGEELTRGMVKELGAVSESESARMAFNALAGFWNGAPLPEIGEGDPGREMERAAQARDLRLYRFSGNLGALLRINHPAVLELIVPGLNGKRYLSLVGIENERLLVNPPVSGRRSFSFSELETCWSGHGYLLWKDPLGLLTGASPGSRGDRIGRLQDLLREAGAYRRPSNSVYDNDTVSAVKEFQSSVGIEQDGIIGGQTLMLLYRSVGRFGVPKLTGGGRMSVILEALRKLDREKSLRRGTTTDIRAEILTPGPLRSGKKMLLYFVAVSIVTAAITYGVLMRFDVQQKSSPPPASIAAKVRQPALPLPTPSLSESKSSPSASALILSPVSPPARAKEASPPASPKTPSPRQEVSPFPSQSSPAQESLPSPVIPLPRSIQQAPPPPQSREAVHDLQEVPERVAPRTNPAAESSAPATSGAEKKAAQQVFSEPVPDASTGAEKPLRAPVPESPADPPVLRISGIVWSEDASQRVAVINGMTLSEGDSIEGVKVVQILPTRVRFLHNTSPFEVLLGSTTSVK